MAEKQTNKERLKEITARIEEGIKEVFTSGKYADYLRTMSRFTRYSVNNRLLIYSQNPCASHVAGYQAWQTKFERHVVKGAKGITIIAPTPFKKKIEQEKLDPDTKLPMLDNDGYIITEEKEIKIPMFKPVTVFDVADTDGKPLPVLAETLVGDVQNYDVFMEALRRSSPVPILFEPMDAGMDGFFSLTEQNIHLREGMSEIQTVCTAVHEITHAKLHNSDMLYSDNSEEMVFDRSDIEDFDGLFGITREEWDAVKDTIPPRDVEQRFMDNPADAMAVYQLKEDAPVELLFTGLERLDSLPDKANYTAVYTRDLIPDDDTTRILENFLLYFQR